MYILHIPALILTIISLVVIFRRNKNAQAGSLPKASLLLTLPYIIFTFFALLPAYEILFKSETIGGGGSGLAATAIIYYLLSSIAALLGFIFILPKSYKSWLFILIFILTTIVLYAPEAIYAKQDIKNAISIGTIGGISKSEAQKCAENDLNPNTKFTITSVTKYDDKWSVVIQLLDKNGSEILTRNIYINLAKCEVVRDFGEAKIDFTFVENGQPMNGLEVFLERKVSYVNSAAIHGGAEDYGITDASGKVKLLISPQFQYTIYMRGSDNKLFYYDLTGDQPSYTIDYSQAKPALKNSLGCEWIYDIKNVDKSSQELCTP